MFLVPVRREMPSVELSIAIKPIAPLSSWSSVSVGLGTLAPQGSFEDSVFHKLMVRVRN